MLGLVEPHRPGPGRAAPGKLVISLALALETGVFLWLGVAVAVPWRFAIVPAIIVAAVLATAMAGSPRNDRGARPWPIRAAFGLALAVDIALATFLVFILLLVLAQEALAGEGFLLFLVVPLVLAFALFLEVGLPLFLILALVLISATGVLMDTEPLWFLAVPLVISIGVGSVLFRAIAPDPGPSVRRLAGARWRGRGSGPA